MRNTFGLCVLVALSLGVVPSRADAQSAERLTVILDTDIGADIDDAWALGFAMQSPDIDLVGVTITDGNTAARARVACKLLHVGGRDEVPVAVGRKTSDARRLPVQRGPKTSPPSSPFPNPPPTSSSTPCESIRARSRSSPSDRCRTWRTRSERSRTSARC